MLPPDKLNPGGDPHIEHGDLSLPKPEPKVSLRFRFNSGCYLTVFCFLVMLLIGACSLMTWGGWLLSQSIASRVGPLAAIDGRYVAVALFCGLLLFLAFVVGFMIPPWRKIR